MRKETQDSQSHVRPLVTRQARVFAVFSHLFVLWLMAILLISCDQLERALGSGGSSSSEQDPLDGLDSLAQIRLASLEAQSEARTDAGIAAAVEAWELARQLAAASESSELEATTARIRARLEAMSRFRELPSACDAALALAATGNAEDQYRAFKLGCTERLLREVGEDLQSSIDAELQGCVLRRVTASFELHRARVSFDMQRVVPSEACEVSTSREGSQLVIDVAGLSVTPAAAASLTELALQLESAAVQDEDDDAQARGDVDDIGLDEDAHASSRTSRVGDAGGVREVSLEGERLTIELEASASATSGFASGSPESSEGPGGEVELAIGQRPPVSSYEVVSEWAGEGAPGRSSGDAFVVVLDPGHGGEETGARFEDLAESTLVMDLALRAERYLNEVAPSLRVILTRRTDTELSLDNRATFANRFGADLFVSIHLNALNEPVRRGGITTFVLDTSGSAQALRLAARENGTTSSSVTGIQHLLATLHRRSQRTASSQLAEAVQRSTLAAARAHLPEIPDRGVRSAAFYVLVGATMPAILLEASFLTKPEEAEALRTESYRQALAEGLARGILSYLQSRSESDAAGSAAAQ